MTSSGAPAPAHPIVTASPTVISAFQTVTAVPSTVAAVYARIKK